MEYRSRHLEDRILRVASAFPIVLLTGARQTGKSTLLGHLFPQADSVVFDPVIDVGGAREDPELFLRQRRRPIVLDEVQYAPELLSVIKRLADQDPVPGQYLLTGSQNLMVIRNASESMAGRAVVLDLPFLSLAERCGVAGGSGTGWIHDLFLDDAFERIRLRGRLPSRPAERDLYARLWRGGFPAALDLADDLLPSLFESYLRTYVERDIQRVAAPEEPQLFSRFVAICAAMTGQEIHHSRIGAALGISYKTAQGWLSVLTATFQWLEVPSYAGSPVKRVSHHPKGYYADTGLAAWLQRISSPLALGGHPSQGALFETHVALEIHKLSRLLSPPPRLWHWRSHGGSEVDLLLERDGVFVPVEAKCRTRVTRADARGIRAFRAAYPHLRQGPGVIVTAGGDAELVEKDVIAIPYDTA